MELGGLSEIDGFGCGGEGIKMVYILIRTPSTCPGLRVHVYTRGGHVSGLPIQIITGRTYTQLIL